MFRLFLAVGALALGFIISRQASYARAYSLALMGKYNQLAHTRAGPVDYTLTMPETDGQPDAKTGGQRKSTVLYLHGTPGGSDQGPIAAQHVLPEWEVLAPSRPGYLYTPLEIGRTPAEQAETYKALLDELRIPQVAIVAISGGAPSAIEFVLRYPDHVCGLILASSVTASTTATESPLTDYIATDLGAWVVRKLVNLIPGAMALPTDPSLRQIARQLAETHFPFDLRLAGLRNDDEQFTRLPDYPWDKISVPTLVIHGDHDKIVPLEQARAVAARIPHAELLVVEGGNHIFSIINPTTVREINNFLASLSSVPMQLESNLP